MGLVRLFVLPSRPPFIKLKNKLNRQLQIFRSPFEDLKRINDSLFEHITNIIKQFFCGKVFQLKDLLMKESPFEQQETYNFFKTSNIESAPNRIVLFVENGNTS